MTSPAVQQPVPPALEVPPVPVDLRGILRSARSLSTGRLALADVRAEFGRSRPDAEPVCLPSGMARQLVRFVVVGVAGTLAYMLLFVLLRTAVGAQAANLAALLLTALGNTAANRRLTFGVRGREGRLRHQGQGLVVFLLGLGLTSGALALLAAVTASPPRWLELLVLVVANALATLLRFLLLRQWVFRAPVRPPVPSTSATVHALPHEKSREQAAAA